MKEPSASLPSVLEAAGGKRADNIQSLRRKEVNSENSFKKATSEAREKKDAYNSAATKLKQLQSDVAAAKSVLAAANKAEEQTTDAGANDATTHHDDAGGIRDGAHSGAG